MANCTFCQKEVTVEKPGRAEDCPFCSRPLHCCYQCRFYDAASHNECHEPQAERVINKDKGNFCDYFIFDPQISKKQSSQEDSLSKLEALFKKGS